MHRKAGDMFTLPTANKVLQKEVYKVLTNLQQLSMKQIRERVSVPCHFSEHFLLSPVYVCEDLLK